VAHAIYLAEVIIKVRFTESRRPCTVLGFEADVDTAQLPAEGETRRYCVPERTKVNGNYKVILSMQTKKKYGRGGAVMLFVEVLKRM
jgi:hypothetical protein